MKKKTKYSEDITCSHKLFVGDNVPWNFLFFMKSFMEQILFSKFSPSCGASTKATGKPLDVEMK